tara:strand:+ start:3090 stop:3890 length:801 start_codon:yes stop_codon:yes gene_type:complete
MLDQKEGEGKSNFGFPKEDNAKPGLKNKSYFGVPSHKVKFSSLNKKVEQAAGNNLKTTEEKKKPFDPFPTKKKEPGKFKSFLLQRRTIIVVAIIIVVLGMASLTPVITGQTVLSAAEVQKMETTLSVNNLTITNLTNELSTTKTSLDSSKTAYDNLLKEKTNLISKLSTANSELGSLKTKLTSLEKTEQMNKDLEKFNYNLKEKAAKLEDDLDDLQDDYDEVVGNSARNICCKKKIDDSSITSYKVKDGKVSCLTSGGTTLDCSFS